MLRQRSYLVESRKRYYVTQYEGVWSMNRKDYIRFLKHGVTGKHYELDDFNAKEIKMKARRAITYHDAVQPLDWEALEFRDELERMERSK